MRGTELAGGRLGSIKPLLGLLHVHTLYPFRRETFRNVILAPPTGAFNVERVDHDLC